MTKRICLHGPESTGKSTLGTRLAAHLGCEVVPEYGRAYCEAHGTDIGMAELVHIAQTQDAMNQAAAAREGAIVLFDTDPLITAVWAEMMFGTRDPWFDSFSSYADLYLLLDIDLPFVDDGLRVYASPEQRQRFFDLCKTELDRRGVRYALIQGEGEARFEAALLAIG
ncbi:AAA family ATPase [Sphingorhabdus sp.]|uniref:AAA family ATPase n=1 Tax=Sphingorhabdus sp. TaxID=1902408 RepID=UPI00359356DC